jgi:hypothetical protein
MAVQPDNGKWLKHGELGGSCRVCRVILTEESKVSLLAARPLSLIFNLNPNYLVTLTDKTDINPVSPL